MLVIFIFCATEGLYVDTRTLMSGLQRSDKFTFSQLNREVPHYIRIHNAAVIPLDGERRIILMLERHEHRSDNSGFSLEIRLK